MKDYKIHIDKDLDIKSKNILNDYWLIQNGTFLNKPTEIVQTHDITQGELTKLVQKHSHCEINHGNCRGCNELIQEKLTSKTEYISSIRNEIHTCSKCEIRFREIIVKHAKDELEKTRKKTLLNFEKAINEKKWNELPEDELIILYNIIDNKTKSKIYANVFEGNYSDKRMWNYVNKFQNLGLMNVSRNGFSVIGFEFDERINEAIRDLLHIKSADNINQEIVLDYLSFSLSKKENKETNRQPDYGGTFILQKDVILKAEVKYIYGGWVQTDGSINLKFTPLSNLESNNVTQETINNGPQVVGKIQNEMFNKIQNDMSDYQNVDHDFKTLDSVSYEDDDYDVPF